jgi:hypothetical protein
MESALTYQDFDVLLERAGAQAYRARVLHAPAGEAAPVDVRLPFQPFELENFLLRVGRPRHGGTRRVDSPEGEAIKAFGGQLYSALFHNGLQDCLHSSLNQTRSQGAGLRIRLRLGDCPELVDLPWEFLYDRQRDRFVCLSRHTPLVRYLELPDPPRPLTVQPPLHVLAMIASPSDYDQLDVDDEWGKLQGALGELQATGQVTLDRVQPATMDALQQYLRRGNYHILHFIGHGGFDPQAQAGVLVCEDQTGRGRRVNGAQLGWLLSDHDPLRLAVLNACEGARADATDPFAGVAQGLLRQGLPAVVAMQFEITDQAAITFARELYAAVADNYPLDAALAEARKAILNQGNQTEWATPVLYSRAPDGRLFDLATASPIRPSDQQPHQPGGKDDERVRILNELYAEGLNSFSTQQWDMAVDAFRQVLTHERDYRDTAVKLEEARRQQQLASRYAAAPNTSSDVHDTAVDTTAAESRHRLSPSVEAAGGKRLQSTDRTSTAPDRPVSPPADPSSQIRQQARRAWASRRLSLLLAISLVAVGVVAIGVRSLALLSHRPGTHTVMTVPSNEPWTNTGITLARGQTISISVEGKISATVGISNNPDGVPGRLQDPMAVLPQANYAALIARIGSDGTPFLIGTQSTLRSEAAGQLLLGVNDRYYPDNTGRFIARVTVSK